MRSFRPNPLVARWLRAEGVTSDDGDLPDWETWLLRRMSHGEVIDVGGVMVDRAILRQRFACVSDRCAPGPARGRYRSCCADAMVSLSGAENRRLASRGADLLHRISVREPRLHGCGGRAFYRDAVEPALARPGGRCVFSKLDDQGRIRCHLHSYAKQAHIDRGGLQPLSCRLFPLIVVDCGGGRVLLTVVASHTRRLVSAYPPKRYPCLDDTSLPPLYESLRADLDWVFGNGFAKALATSARAHLNR